MRVVEPHQFKHVKHPKRPSKRMFVSTGILLVLAVYVAVVLGRPLPAATADAKPLTTAPTTTVSLNWPSYGQAAAGAVGYGPLATNGEQKALPTASVAKVMTALAVLKQKPLKVGEQGPTLVMTQEDVDEYVRTVAMDGSNVPVVVGEEITQYQALQALLLPSSNNMAHTLARWAYGSDEEYLRFVNNFAKSLGMKNTNFDDASGYSPQTVSTSEDLVRLAVNAMDHPVIAEIAAQQDAVIPVAGRIYNVNMLLGRNGIVGVKTGNTEEAGGCFMAAAVREIDGKKIMAVSVIMGAPNLSIALRDSVPLVNSVLDGFESVTLAKAGQAVGTYSVKWGKPVDLIAEKDMTLVRWRGQEVKTDVSLQPDHSGVGAGKPIGTMKADAGRDSVEGKVLLASDISDPTLLWKLIPR